MGCSGEQKVTEMVMKVDLQCYECYKKVKRLLCKFPQIRNQVFDEKQNIVTITVVCCSPERIRDKLCSKGRKSIKSIDIKKPLPNPEKPQAADKPPAKPQAADKPPAKPPAPAEQEQPEKPKPKAAPAPAQEKPPEKLQKNGSKSGSKNGSKSEPAAAAEPKQQSPKPAALEPVPEDPKPKAPEPQAEWVPGYPPAGPPPQQAQAQMSMYPVAVCYDGVPAGGPCYQYGPNHYGYAYGRPSYPPGPGYYPAPGRPDCNYFSEENPSACFIM